MITLKEVAKSAKVSLSTASLALRNDPRVKEETRKRIRAVADELEYRPNGIARDLKTRRTRMVSVLLHDLGGPFYSELIRGVQNVANEYGYTTIVSNTNQEGAAARLLLERRVEGAVILAPDISNEVLEQSASLDLPVVVLDRELNSENIFTVRVDNVQGGYLATSHLIEQGFREIAFISGAKDSLDSDERYLGYLRAIRESSLAIKSKRFEGDFTEESGYRIAADMVAQSEIPRSIFAANDEMAVGVIKALSANGVRIPDDVAIVGFDNIEISEYVRPSLTTIEQPMYQMGKTATELLFQALNGDSGMSTVSLRTTLVMRESSMRNGTT